MKIFSYIVGVDEEGLSTGDTQCQQHTSSADKPLGVLQWDEMRWLFVFLFFPPRMYASTYKSVACSWCRKRVSQCIPATLPAQ